MHTVTFLQDLAVVMIAASLAMVLFRRLKQPVVLGYILAGMVIGPHTPPYSFIHDEATINTLSELGVILLMFSLGLEFSLRKLKSVGAPALLAALMEIFLLFWVGFEVGRFFGWATMDSVFLGAMLSMSSTTVIIKVLGELGLMKQGFSQLVFGILIIEDILGIAMIALLSGIAMTGTMSFGEVGATLGKLSIFLAVVLVVGLIAVPRLIAYVSRYKSNEMLIITLLGLCFGVSLLAVKLGYSVALGAFIIGAVIAEAREIHRIEALIEPVRDMFSAVFFVAIGLLIDPKMLLLYWQPILFITLAVVLGKVVTCTLGAFAGGKDVRTSLHVGFSLAQIGEFSFIIAALGVSLKVTSSFLYPIAVAVSAITTLLTPYLIRSAPVIASLFERKAPRPVVDTMSLYTSWIGRMGGSGANAFARNLLWKWAAQIGLNVLLISAVFLGVAYVGATPPALLLSLLPDPAWLKTTLWLLAVLVALPFVIAVARKLQAVGLLIAEMKVTRSLAGNKTDSIRQIIASLVPIAGTVALGLYMLLFSSALLPPTKVLLLLLFIIALVTWWRWRSFTKVYSLAQAALNETFEREPEHATPGKGVPETSKLPEEADIGICSLPAGSPLAGLMIRELALRTKTGASIVSIERAGVNSINPGPDEEIHPGDKLTLLGTPSQLAQARAFLAGKS